MILKIFFKIILLYLIIKYTLLKTNNEEPNKCLEKYILGTLILTLL